MCLGIEALEALGGTFDDLTLVVNGFDTQRASSPATEAFRALLAWLTGGWVTPPCLGCRHAHHAALPAL